MIERAFLFFVSLGLSGLPSQAAEEVRLGYFPNITHAQAVLGVSTGKFQQALGSAKLTSRIFNAGPSMIEALFAGQIDIGYVGPGPALNAQAKSQGQAIRVVAGAACNGVVIIARKDSGISKLADLAGKKIATPQHGNTQDISARHYLIDVLKQPNASNILPIPNAEQAGLLSRGQIDAAWVPEPWGAILLKQGDTVLLAEEKDLWPNGQLMLTAVITTPQFLQNHPDKVAALLQVHKAFTRQLNAEPQALATELGDALEKLTGKKLPPDVITDAIQRIRFTDHALPETFTEIARWSHDLGFCKRRIKIDGLIDESILNSLKNQP